MENFNDRRYFTGAREACLVIDRLREHRSNILLVREGTVPAIVDETLIKENIAYVGMDDVTDVTEERLVKAMDLVRDRDCGCVVGIGGKHALALARVIAALTWQDVSPAEAGEGKELDPSRFLPAGLVPGNGIPVPTDMAVETENGGSYSVECPPPDFVWESGIFEGTGL